MDAGHIVLIAIIVVLLLMPCRAANPDKPPPSAPDFRKPTRTPSEVDAIAKQARLRKIERATPPSIRFDPNRPTADSGQSVRIVYVDSNGEVTEREVLNWHIEGRYLVGFCTLRGMVRKFRLDRVDEWKGWG